MTSLELNERMSLPASDVTQSLVPVSTGRLTILSLVALVCGLGVAHWLDGRGASSFEGQLEARTTIVCSEQFGRIASIKVIQGQHVGVGESLFSLADEQLNEKIARKTTELSDLNDELTKVKAKVEVEIQWRLRELSNEIFETELKASNVAHERLTKQVEQFAWHDQLSGRFNDSRPIAPSFASNSTFHSLLIETPMMDERRVQAMLKEDAASSAAETLSTQLNLCEQRLSELKKLSTDLPNLVRTSLGIELIETQIRRGESELQTLAKQRDSLTISSPSRGIVGKIHRDVRDRVEPQENVIEIFDDEQRYLTALIPSSTVAHLKSGTKVSLLFPARNKRIGLVTDIPPHTTLSDVVHPDDSLVAVRIEPAGKLWPKSPVGSRVRVQVPQ